HCLRSCVRSVFSPEHNRAAGHRSAFIEVHRRDGPLRNRVSFHYEKKHRASDPDLITVLEGTLIDDHVVYVGPVGMSKSRSVNSSPFWVIRQCCREIARSAARQIALESSRPKVNSPSASGNTAPLSGPPRAINRACI